MAYCGYCRGGCQLARIRPPSELVLSQCGLQLQSADRLVAETLACTQGLSDSRHLHVLEALLHHRLVSPEPGMSSSSWTASAVGCLPRAEAQDPEIGTVGTSQPPVRGHLFSSPYPGFRAGGLALQQHQHALKKQLCDKPQFSIKLA